MSCPGARCGVTGLGDVVVVVVVTAGDVVWVGTVVGFVSVLIKCRMLGSGSDCRRALDPVARSRDTDVGMTLVDVAGVMCTEPAVVDVVIAAAVSWCGWMPYSVRSIIDESFSMRLHKWVLCCCCCCCCCIIMFIMSFIISMIMF